MEVKLEKVNCDFCGSDILTLFAEQKDLIHKVDNSIYQVVTCNKCGFTEFYELTEEEVAPINKKASMIFIFAAVVPTLIGIGVSIWLIWG